MKILNWITPVTYGPQQSSFLQNHEPGTGTWFMTSNVFQKWLNVTRSTLFCPGNPGAGKTILTSIVVRELFDRFEDNEEIGIAYLYCNFKKQDEQGVADLLASLLKQLAQGRSHLPDCVTSLYKKHNEKNRRTRPMLEEVTLALRDVANLYGKVFIVVDALDETHYNHRSDFLEQILTLQKVTPTNILATSRPISEIEEYFAGSLMCNVSAQKDDMGKYLDRQISRRLPLLREVSRETPQRSAYLKNEIKQVITEASNGM